jgi:hypothetical protein
MNVGYIILFMTFDFNLSAVYRINWLRARAKMSRWKEEIVLIPQEMQWTVRFFEFKCREWEEHRKSSVSAGQRSYAARQRAMWMYLHSHATSSFRSCLATHSP